MSRALTVTEVLALPASIDVVTAGRALGIGRTTAYELVRTGQWPTPLLSIGRKYRVRRSDLLALLGLDPGDGEAGPPQGDPTTRENGETPQPATSTKGSVREHTRDR